jgi:Peptidase M15
MKSAAHVALLSLGAIVLVAVVIRVMAGTVGHVTSWWRNPWKNTEVGGLIGSAHLIGWAADITPVTPETEALARARFPVVVNEGNHLHVSLFRA